MNLHLNEHTDKWAVRDLSEKYIFCNLCVICFHFTFISRCLRLYINANAQNVYVNSVSDFLLHVKYVSEVSKVCISMTGCKLTLVLII